MSGGVPLLSYTNRETFTFQFVKQYQAGARGFSLLKNALARFEIPQM
jgi:hypothetical protein